MNSKFFKILISIFLFSLSLNLNAFYSVVTTPTAINSKFFALIFPNCTSFYAKADSVTGISKQKYILDDLEVTEVVIDIDSSTSQVRLFSTSLLYSDVDLSTDDMDELLNDNNTADADDSGISEDVSVVENANIVKTSPDTTHSKIIEYKVNAEELLLFYNDFCKHLQLNDLSTDIGTIYGSTYVFTGNAN